MAIIGYLMFGSKVNSQITLNLPADKLSSKIAIYTTLVNPLSKYALMLQPVVNAAEGWFPKHRKNRYFKIIVRTLLVISQVFVALVVPFFGYLMTLVGAFLSLSASITIPCLCYLKITSRNDNYKSNYRFRLVERSFIWGIVCFSLLIMVTGTYTSIINIVKEIRHK